MQTAKDSSISISITKIVTGLLTPLLVGFVIGGFTVVRTSDVTSVVVAGHTVRLEKLEDTYVPRSELDQQFKYFNDSLVRIEKSIDKLSVEIKELK